MHDLGSFGRQNLLRFPRDPQRVFFAQRILSSVHEFRLLDFVLRQKVLRALARLATFTMVHPVNRSHFSPH
jgi:hypothetical protein